jgi:hypothetical protein
MARLGFLRAKYLARYRQLCMDLVIDIEADEKICEEQGARAGVLGKETRPPSRKKAMLRLKPRTRSLRFMNDI